MNEASSIIAIISYNIRSLILFLFLYMLTGVYVSFTLAGKLHMFILIFLGLIVFIILPLVFIKPIAKKFRKKAAFIFYDDFVLVKILNLQTEEIQEETKFSYEAIKSCVLTSSSSKTSSLTLYFANKKKTQYFFDADNDPHENNEKYEVNISENIFKKLYVHNNKINLLPSFYASQKGIVIFILLTALFIFDVIVNIIYKPSFLPFSFLMGAVLYFRVFMSRTSAIKAYKDLKNSLNEVQS